MILLFVESFAIQAMLSVILQDFRFIGMSVTLNKHIFVQIKYTSMNIHTHTQYYYGC